MKKIFTTTCLLFSGLFSFAQTSPQTQIEQALLAAPEEEKTAATVMGYNDKNEFVVLTNKNM